MISKTETSLKRGYCHSNISDFFLCMYVSEKNNMCFHIVLLEIYHQKEIGDCTREKFVTIDVLCALSPKLF